MYKHLWVLRGRGGGSSKTYINVLSTFCARLHLAGTAGGTREGLLVSGMGLAPGSLPPESLAVTLLQCC